jgi:hypothetical protein
MTPKGHQTGYVGAYLVLTKDEQDYVEKLVSRETHPANEAVRASINAKIAKTKTEDMQCMREPAK